MSNSEAKLRERLKKILALAKAGVGGEKQNAQRMLEKLLAKHNMSLSELLDEEAKSRTWFTYSGKLERQLFIQCIYKTNPNWDGSSWSRKGIKNLIGVELTKAESIELTLLWETHRRAYRKDMKKQLDNFLHAYVHVNDLYPNTTSEAEEAGTNLSMEDMEAILGMVGSMRPTPVFNAIEQGRAA